MSEPEDVTVSDRDLLAQRFEAHRGHLRAVALRMLGSSHEADDAVQEAWLRLSRADADSRGQPRRLADHRGGPGLPGHAAGPGRRSGRSRRTQLPTRSAAASPEDEALLADSVGLALLVVLDTLAPAERLAFVLHDMFAVPFEEIAPIVGRTPVAARQLASRARRRVQADPAVPDVSAATQREVVAAFLAASREGDFSGLLQAAGPGRGPARRRRGRGDGRRQGGGRGAGTERGDAGVDAVARVFAGRAGAARLCPGRRPGRRRVVGRRPGPGGVRLHRPRTAGSSPSSCSRTQRPSTSSTWSGCRTDPSDERVGRYLGSCLTIVRGRTILKEMPNRLSELDRVLHAVADPSRRSMVERLVGRSRFGEPAGASLSTCPWPPWSST